MCGGPLKCGGPCSAEHVRTLVNPALRKANEIANFHTPRVFNAPADGVPLGILYRRRGPRKLE